MRANTGGQIAPADVIGRDRLIGQIWRALEQQSVVLTAARRMGKTSIITKMKAEPRTNVLPVYHDLEGLRTPLEFVETVYNDVEAFLSTKRKAAKRARDFISQFSGGEFQGIKIPAVLAPHWKTLLQKTLEDLTEHRTESIVFFWDEMPMMLENIKQDNGETVAMELLDTLRSIRQMNPTVRMVYTGSVGLHHVVTALKRSGYANAPTNDMKKIEVLPLSEGDARLLARLLLEGEAIDTPDRDGLASIIAQSVDNVAFYIHQVVDRLIDWHEPVDAAAVHGIVTRCLFDAKDPWDMGHYRRRIDTYYLPEERTIALHLLDGFAIAESRLTHGQIVNLLQTQTEVKDIEQVREVLHALDQDHYLTRQPDGTYGFYLPLIRRWWREHRDLAQ